jgi:tetratricopeptide (TPR) repeat protein
MTAPAQVLFRTFALVALTLSSAHAGTPAAEPDWQAALATLARLKDQPQSVEGQRASLDSLKAAILDKAPGGGLSPLILDTALSLTELRVAPRTPGPNELLSDPYELLSVVRDAGGPALSDRARRERLAAAFLAADLPWSVVDLLDPIKSQLDDAGGKTLSAAALALRIIRDDAAAVAPGSMPYHGLSATGAGLLHLLGVPSSIGGSYSDFTPEVAERVHKSDADAEEDRRIYTGPPLLKILFGAAPPQPVNKYWKVTSGRLSPKRTAANSPAAAALSRVVHPTGNDVKSDAGVLASFARSSGLCVPPEPTGNLGSCRLEFAGSLPFRGGAILQFDLYAYETDSNPNWGLFLIAVERGPAGVDFYSEELEGGAASADLIDAAGPSEQIALTSAVGSGHFMSLEIFDPATGRLWGLANYLVGGEYNLLRFGGGVPFAVLVSATGDQRFSDCTQCQARRDTIFIRYVPSTRSYAAVAERGTGTDLFRGGGSVGLMGLSPDMSDDHQREADLFARLDNHSPDYIAGGLVKDIDAAVDMIKGRYCAARRFSAAVQKYRSIIESLAADGNSAAVRQARAEVQIDLVVTLVSDGDYRAAAALAQDPDLKKAAGDWRDTRLHYLSAAANLALATGDYRRLNTLLREWREFGTAASEGTLTRYLTLVGDYRNARSAGLRALDRAIAEHDPRYVALDMLHLANAGQHLGRTPEALDWLARALRLTRGSDLDAFAWPIAADIALQNGLPEIAMLLLDQAIITIGEDVWDENGAMILLLYGKALEQDGDVRTADLVYQAAARCAARQRSGSVLMTAYSRRAGLAARRGDMALAAKLSGSAFRIVSDGRAGIGREYYRPSFVATARSVGDQYRRLHAKN